jgi:hypothetical protein
MRKVYRLLFDASTFKKLAALHSAALHSAKLVTMSIVDANSGVPLARSLAMNVKKAGVGAHGSHFAISGTVRW